MPQTPQFASPYAAAGNAIFEYLRDREAAKQQQFTNDLATQRESRLASADAADLAYKQQQIALTQELRNQQAERAQAELAATKLKSQLAVGDVTPIGEVTPERALLLPPGSLRGGGLPSTQGAFMTAAPAVTANGPQAVAPAVLGGTLRQDSGNPTYIGTPQQQALDTLKHRPDLTPDQQKLLLAMEGFGDKSVTAKDFIPPTPAAETEAVMRVNPQKGGLEQIGTVPKGARILQQAQPPSNFTISPTAEANLLMRLQAQYDTNTKAERTMEQQLKLMQTGLQQFRNGETNGGSQAVLVTFQKMLDPNSVVRESEYARSAAGLGVLNQLEGMWQKAKEGGAGVPEADLAAMVQTAQQFLTDMHDANAGIRGRTGATAEHFNIPQNLVFPNAPANTKTPAVVGGETPDQRAKRLYDSLTQGAK